MTEEFGHPDHIPSPGEPVIVPSTDRESLLLEMPALNEIADKIDGVFEHWPERVLIDPSGSKYIHLVDSSGKVFTEIVRDILDYADQDGSETHFQDYQVAALIAGDSHVNQSALRMWTGRKNEVQLDTGTLTAAHLDYPRHSSSVPKTGKPIVAAVTANFINAAADTLPIDHEYYWQHFQNRPVHTILGEEALNFANPLYQRYLLEKAKAQGGPKLRSGMTWGTDEDHTPQPGWRVVGVRLQDDKGKIEAPGRRGSEPKDIPGYTGYKGIDVRCLITAPTRYRPSMPAVAAVRMAVDKTGNLCAARVNFSSQFGGMLNLNPADRTEIQRDLQVVSGSTFGQ